MIEDTKELKREAQKAYMQSRSAEAVLLYARIRRSCDEMRDHTGAFAAGVWETESLLQGGHYQQAMSLLLTLMAQPPADAPTFERWIAQKKLFDIISLTRPELARLRRAMDDILALAQQQTHPPSDIPYLAADLFRYQGKWIDALQHYGQAWTSHIDKEGGYLRCGAACYATEIALQLHRLHEARTWRDHLAQTDQAEWADARRQLCSVNSRIALYTNDCVALTECRDSGCGTNELEARIHLVLRGDSCQPHEDPCYPFHPARALLRKGLEDSKNVHIQYDYRLAVVDYHLANLRYSTGLPAVDDYYYQRPDAISLRREIGDTQDFTNRLRSFDKAWCRLDRHARWLDGLLQCDYRTTEGESRRQRRDAIVQDIA